MKLHILSHQPKGVAFIAFTQMWESFSFFGMRALLVLFLITELGYAPEAAFILYTLYIAFVKVFGAVGGYVVDRFLGCKRAVVMGGGLIMLGHILLTFSTSSPLFFLALGSIVCGSALFRVSLQVLLGLLYEKEDPRRDKGFTFFYIGMNLGGLSAAVLCGFIANIYGWHAGFGLAALGMALSIAIFCSKIRIFDGLKSPQTSFGITIPACLVAPIVVASILSFFEIAQSLALPIGLVALGALLYKLTKKMTKKLAISLIGSLILLALYFTAEELWGSLLMIFSEMHIHRTIFGIEIPSAVIAAVNPLTIILLGPLIAKKEFSFGVKLALAFLSLGIAFFILYVAALLAEPSILYLVFGLSAIAIGEVFIAPTVLSFASKAAPSESAGTMMGAATLAFSMGTLFSGEVAKISLGTGQIFLFIGIAALGIFALIVVKKNYVVVLDNVVLPFKARFARFFSA